MRDVMRNHGMAVGKGMLCLQRPLSCCVENVLEGSMSRCREINYSLLLIYYSGAYKGWLLFFSFPKLELGLIVFHFG